MSIDLDTQAAKNFYRQVREFAERTKPWEKAKFYEVKPDERWNPLLVSYRVYGRWDEYLVVMAAAGLHSVDQPLEQKTIVLPTEEQLYQIKRNCNFESIADYREDYQPVWVDD